METAPMRAVPQQMEHHPPHRHLPLVAVRPPQHLVEEIEEDPPLRLRRGPPPPRPSGCAGARP